MKIRISLTALVLGVAAMLLLPSCHQIKNETIEIWADHFVWEFYDGANLSLQVEDSICAIYLSRDKSGERYRAYRLSSEKCKSLRRAHPKAVARCEALGDVGFDEMACNQVVTFAPYEFHKYPYSPVAAVDIRADTTLFNGVPAGEPLDSWFEFLSFSPDEYIRSGYRTDIPRITACRDTLPSALRLPFLCGTPPACCVRLDERRHPDAIVISPDDGERELAALPVYGRLSEIAFGDYECLGMDEVVGVLRPITPIGRKGMESLRVTVRFRDGSVRVAKIEWNDQVSRFLHGGDPFGEREPMPFPIMIK